MKSFFKMVLYITNGLLYLAIIAMWIAIPGEITLNTSASIFNICLSIMLLCWDHNKFTKYYTSNYFKKLTSALVSASLIFCILALVNYLSFKHPKQFDLSRNEINTLTKQTEAVLKGMEGKIIFKVFSRKANYLVIRKLLDLYRYNKNDVLIEFVDVELRPDQVKKYGITHAGTVVAEYKGRKQFILKHDELHITNVLIKLSRPKDPVLYYIVGHQGPNFENKSKQGLSDLKQLLEKSYYKAVPLSLTNLPSIPSDADALIIWGPRTPFLPHELGVIKKFVLKGGRLLLALDPDFNKDKFSELRKVLKRLGIDIPNNLVVDTLNHVSGSNGTVPLVKKFTSKHPIVTDIPGPVFFPLTSSIKSSGDGKSTGALEVMVKTTTFPASWAENTPEEVIDGKVEYSQGRDDKGPISIMGVWQDKVNDSKIVIFGNSTFVSNIYAKYGSNFLLFLRSISWLVDNDQIKSFNLPIGKNDPIFISKNQLGVIFYFSVIFAPIILFGTSFFFYRRKRRL